jgi:hypothetical protein
MATILVSDDAIGRSMASWLRNRAWTKIFFGRILMSFNSLLGLGLNNNIFWGLKSTYVMLLIIYI